MHEHPTRQEHPSVQPLQVFYVVCLASFGLLFGSFGNVLIWRVPRGESIVGPPSHCPLCGHDVRWYDNVPVVSWLLLRGRCRDCGAPISPRYPIVELASGGLWVLAGSVWGFSPAIPLAIAFLYLLLVLSVIDLDTRRLPTPLVTALAVVGGVAAVAAQVTGLPFGPLTGLGISGWLAQPVVAAAVGFAAGAGTSVAIAMVYRAVRGHDGLGFGDVRLLGAMGLVLGPFVLLAYALGNIIGVLVAVPQALLSRKGGPLSARSIPFGPFLALGGVLTALWGPAMWAWYLRLLNVT
jgi:leader peptidase (prepilin peptidase)/N-methyltransferase